MRVIALKFQEFKKMELYTRVEFFVLIVIIVDHCDRIRTNVSLVNIYVDAILGNVADSPKHRCHWSS